MLPDPTLLLAETEISFEFAHAQGDLQWLLSVFILAAVLLGWFAWRRYGPAPRGWPGRVARCCRVGAIIVLVAMLSGPTWKRTTTLSEPGTLLVLSDHSASMAATDGFADGRPRIAASDLLVEGLRQLPPGTTRVVGYRIGGDIATLDLGQQAGPATGTRSALGEDLEQVVFAQRPDAAILVSDGRITEGSGFAAVATALQEAGVPRLGVWTLGVGTERIDAELRIDEVVVPRDVPLGERQPVLVKLSGRAFDPDQPIILSIRDGDQLLQTVELDPPTVEDELSPVNLEQVLDQIELHTEGEHRLTVEVQQGELQSSTAVTVEVKERTLKVLLLVHRPRYELRYLREALRRDQTIEVHSYLCDGRWRPWGQVPQGLNELPLGPETIKAYDAILIGDFGPDRLTDPEIDRLVKAVKEQGAGLIWLPGEAGSTAGFRNTALGRLLPVRLPGPGVIADGYLRNTPLEIRRTQEAKDQGLLEGDGVQWDLLPHPLGACPVASEDGIVPGSRVLLETKAGEPLVVVGDFGAGKALFVAIDDTWRWRRNVGDDHLIHFWSQLLRYVSSNRSDDGDAWRIIASPQRSIPGELVQLGIVPVGALPDADSLPRQVTVKLTGPNDLTQVVTLDRPGGDTNYLAQLPAPSPGTWLIEALNLPQPASDAELLVIPPGAEIRDPRIDRPALADLAEDTGGRSFVIAADADQPQETIDRLVAALPGLAKERQRIDHDTIWDTWWALLVLGLLLSTEWALRRLFRLP